MEKILQFVGRIQSDERFNTLDEAAVKQGIVLKILSLMDWDPFDIDEVQPEFPVGNGKVDYSLKVRNSAHAFIMVRKEEKKFKGYERELLAYAVLGKVKLAVLTNGITWRFFSPFVDGSNGEKMFHTIDLNRQKPDVVAKSFALFLSKENVISGRAIKAAENIYRIRQREALLHRHLPEAWHKIMSEPEKWLVDVFARATEELCGYNPDRETVEKFIKSKIDAWGGIWEIPKVKQSRESTQVQGHDADAYHTKDISSFRFEKKEHKVNSWQEMLVKLCELIYAKHKEDFEMVLTLTSQDKEYFSEIQYKFLNCEQIPGTDMYVNADLSPEDIVRICHEMLQLFGYMESDFSIETKP